MAEVKAKNAAVSLWDNSDDELVNAAFGWNVDINGDRVDTTRFLDPAPTETTIYVRFTFTAECYFDPDDAEFMKLEKAAREGKNIKHTDIMGSDGEFRFWLDDSRYYSGDANCDISIQTVKEDVIKATVTFNGTGQLSFATNGTKPTS